MSLTLCELISFSVFLLKLFISLNCSKLDDIVIKNKTIDDFKKLCPYTDLCFANRNHSFVENVEGFRRSVPCCQECSCIVGCGKECCPDKPNTFISDKELEEIKEEKVQCVPAQYKTFFEVGVTYSRAYEMISSCPQNTNNTINRKCLKTYQDFDLNDDLEYFGPCESNDVTYKNKYCAECNNASKTKDDTIAWSIGFQCLGQTKLPQFSSFSELLSVVRNFLPCDVVFIPLNVRGRPKRCFPVVDRCNVTGDWDEFDSYVEKACMSYTSLYKSFFKNVHCYLCNKVSGLHTNITCDSPYNPVDLNMFVTLLDFKGLQKTKSSTGDASCPFGYISYSNQERCRKLTCPGYMYADNGTCKSLQLSQSQPAYQLYSVSITLQRRTNYRNDTILPQSIGLLYNALWNHATLHLARSSSNFTVCHLDGFIVFTDKIKDKHFYLAFENELPFSLLDYFAFRFVIGGKIEGLLSSELGIMDELFRNTSESLILSTYSIRYKSIPVDLYERAVLALSNVSNTTDFVLDPNEESPPFRAALVNAITSYLYDGEYGLHIGPLPVFSESIHCPHNAVYQIRELCPKIAFLQDEFTLTDDGLVLNDINLAIHNYEISFTFNNSALICYTLITPWISKTRFTTDIEYSSLDLFTIVCLSLSLLALGASFSIYLLIKQLRSLPGLNIMGLIVCLFSTHLLTLINGVFRGMSGTMCIVSGIAIHTSLLLSMLWMFVCTFHMARVFISLEKLNPRDTNKYPIFFRYIIFTIVISVLLVVINIVVSVLRSNGENFGYDDSECYIETSDMILYTVAVPLGVIVISNVCMFLCVIVKISRMPSMRDSTKSDRNYITIFAKLSTITGVTYIFIFLYQFTELEIFSFIFVFLNASQGVFIFLAFVCNHRILNIIKKSVNDFKLGFTNTKDGDQSASVTRQTRL